MKRMFTFDVSRFKGSDGLVDPLRVAEVWRTPWCERGYELIYRREAIESAMGEMSREIPKKGDISASAWWHERMMNLWADIASATGDGWGSACAHAQIARGKYEEIGRTSDAAKMDDLNASYQSRSDKR